MASPSFPLTCASVRSLNLPELFEFRPRPWALVRMALSARRPWWLMQEQQRLGADHRMDGRLRLLSLRDLGVRCRLVKLALTREALYPKTQPSEAGDQTRSRWHRTWFAPRSGGTV